MRADQEQIQQKNLVGPGGQTLKMTFMPHRIRLYCVPCTSILLYIPNLTIGKTCHTQPFLLIPLACLHTPILLLHFVTNTLLTSPALANVQLSSTWWLVSDPGAFLCFCSARPQFNGNILPVLGPALTSASGPPCTHCNDPLSTAPGVLDSYNCT